MKPEQVLMEWIDAVNSHDAGKLLSLYDKNAALLPTFSNQILNSPEKLEDYFRKLSARKGLHITLHKTTMRIQALDEHKHIISGIYNWQFEVDNELLNFEARFSFVIDISKKAPIIHHHSSQIPRML